MVEVFRTNINKVSQSRVLVKKVMHHFPGSCVNVDLEDCDKVLRVEGADICPETIARLITGEGYICEVMA